MYNNTLLRLYIFGKFSISACWLLIWSGSDSYKRQAAQAGQLAYSCQTAATRAGCHTGRGNLRTGHPGFFL